MNSILGGLEKGGNTTDSARETVHECRRRVWQGSANMENMLTRQLGEIVARAEDLPDAISLTPEQPETPKLTVFEGDKSSSMSEPPYESAAQNGQPLDVDDSRRAIDNLFNQAA
jgi:hypothetical protein